MGGKRLQIFLAALSVLATFAASKGCDATAPTENRNLTQDEIAAVITEPDATTQAIIDAGYQPFAIRISHGAHSGTIIYFGPEGAKIADDHGPREKPWINRQLHDAPHEGNTATYHSFLNGVIIMRGDDWKGKGETRPVVPEHSYECTGGASNKTVTAESLKLLPGKAMAHAVSQDFVLEPGGVQYNCSSN
jgi:hypothetical protein